MYDTPASNNVHTQTDMGGDGSFAASGYKHAAYQRNLSVYKGTSNSVFLVDASDVATFLVSSPSCYNLQLFKDTTNAWRYWIYFGGTGYHATRTLLHSLSAWPVRGRRAV